MTLSTRQHQAASRRPQAWRKLACLAAFGFMGVLTSSAMAFGPQSGQAVEKGAAEKAPSSPAMVFDPVAPQDPNSKKNEPMQLIGAGIVEKLAQNIPGDIEFINENGAVVQLSSFFDPKRPIILNPGYFGCAMLCGEVSNGLSSSVKGMKWTPGEQYQILTVSLDPTETSKLAQLKKSNYMKTLAMPGADKGWHFLVIKDKANAERFIKSTGFGFKWNEIEKEYAHAAGIIMLMPDGRVSRYLYGTDFMPDTLRLSLVEAGNKQIGSFMDRTLLFCFRFDKSANRYTVAAMRLMQTAGAFSVVLIISVIGTLIYREHRSKELESSDDKGSSNDSNTPSTQAGA
jgi:protein SCO1